MCENHMAARLYSNQLRYHEVPAFSVMGGNMLKSTLEFVLVNESEFHQ